MDATLVSMNKMLSCRQSDCFGLVGLISAVHTLEQTHVKKNKLYATRLGDILKCWVADRAASVSAYLGLISAVRMLGANTCKKQASCHMPARRKKQNQGRHLPRPNLNRKRLNCPVDRISQGSILRQQLVICMVALWFAMPSSIDLLLFLRLSDTPPDHPQGGPVVYPANTFDSRLRGN